MVIKIKKKKKSVKEHGQNTYGRGARKKGKGSGHKGGGGMSGTGKRSDHKKTLILKLYGNKYFGKQGITSRGTERKKNYVMNISEISKFPEKIMKKFGTGKNELTLKKYKILGDGEISEKITIIALAFTKTAKEKIEAAGGKAITIKENKTPKESADKNEGKKQEKKDKVDKAQTVKKTIVADKATKKAVKKK